MKLWSKKKITNIPIGGSLVLSVWVFVFVHGLRLDCWRVHRFTCSHMLLVCLSVSSLSPLCSEWRNRPLDTQESCFRKHTHNSCRQHDITALSPHHWCGSTARSYTCVWIKIWTEVQDGSSERVSRERWIKRVCRPIRWDGMNGCGKRANSDIDVCSATVAGGTRWRNRVRKWKKAE